MNARPRTHRAAVPSRIRSRSALVGAAIASLLAGCTTAGPRLLPPPSEQVRSHMLSVTVASASSNPEIVFDGPAKGALEGAWRGARLGFVTTLRVASGVAVSGSKESALAAAAIVAMAPIGALLGAGVGAGAAEPSEKIQEKEALIRQVLVESRARERFHDCVEAAIRELAPHVSLGSSSGERADTIVEIAVERFGLSGNTMLVNPSLQFVTSQHARIRASDGRELHAQALTWRGQFRPLDQWAAEDGTPVKEAVDRACRDIAEALVDELFLLYRPTGE